MKTINYFILHKPIEYSYTNPAVWRISTKNTLLGLEAGPRLPGIYAKSSYSEYTYVYSCIASFKKIKRSESGYRIVFDTALQSFEDLIKEKVIEPLDIGTIEDAIVLSNVLSILGIDE